MWFCVKQENLIIWEGTYYVKVCCSDDQNVFAIRKMSDFVYWKSLQQSENSKHVSFATKLAFYLV